MISPERLVEILKRSGQDPGQVIKVVSHIVENRGRREFRDGVRQERRGALILPLIAEGGRFVDPNSLPTDFIRLLDDNRESIIADLRTVPTLKEPIIFVLISHREMMAPVSPSPVTLPEWFPHLGGREVEISISDSMRDVRVSGLNEAEVGTAGICRLLFEIDVALARRIRRAVADRGPSCAQVLARLGFVPSGDCNTIFAAWESVFASVTDVTTYRLDVRGGTTPLAFVIRVLAATSLDALSSRVQDLAEQMDLSREGSDDFPLLGVLFRPTSIKGVPSGLLTLCVTVFAAYNLINGAAHASQYPRYSAALLLSTGREIRRGLHLGLRMLEG